MLHRSGRIDFNLRFFYGRESTGSDLNDMIDDKKILVLSEAAWNEISRHAQDEFPDECCGVVLSDGRTDRVQRLTNIQNRLHALDPQTYPRTATLAYAMDYRELEAVIDSANRNGAKLKGFYHSHPNHDAYFSPEDKA